MKRSTQEDSVKRVFDQDAIRYLRDRYPEEPKNCEQYSYLVRKSYVLHMLDASEKLSKKRVLDIGCGPGVYTRNLLERGWAVWGMDISNRMLDEAKASLFGLPQENCAHFVLGKATDIPFETSSFDMILCVGLMAYIDDVHRVLSEIARVLKFGGDVIFEISNKLSPFEVEIRLKRLVKFSLRLRTWRDKDQWLCETMKIVHYSPSRFNTLCKQHGLRKQESHYYNFRLPFLGLISPDIGLYVSKRLERLSKSTKLGGLGAGYLVKMSKQT